MKYVYISVNIYFVVSVGYSVIILFFFNVKYSTSITHVHSEIKGGY